MPLQATKHMNAYELFGWAPKFIIDIGELRKKFIVLQLNNHPDLKGDDIEVSAFINESYNTLKDPYKRYSYLLGLIYPDDDEKLDNMWLMEMMELNDSILESKVKESLKPSVKKSLQAYFSEVNLALEKMVTEWDQNGQSGILRHISLELQKIKYLQRLQKIFDGVEEL